MLSEPLLVDESEVAPPPQKISLWRAAAVLLYEVLLNYLQNGLQTIVVPQEMGYFAPHKAAQFVGVLSSVVALIFVTSPVVGRTSDRAGRAPTRPFCDTRPMGGWASFSFFCSGRAGGRRLKIHAGPGGWAVDFSTGRPWASPGF